MPRYNLGDVPKGQIIGVPGIGVATKTEEFDDTCTVVEARLQNDSRDFGAAFYLDAGTKVVTFDWTEEEEL